jgi:uncharacterized protein (DUF1800 family)
MSIAGPGDAPERAERKPIAPVSRRTVLGAALAGGAGIAALRVVVYPRLEELLHGGVTSDGRPDWVSPLGSEQARVAHLLRRTTFGATLDDLERSASDGFSKTVDRLLETRPEAPPPVATPGGRINLAALQEWWVQHMLTSATPFAERMTLFWHGHFTSDYRKVGVQTPFIYWQNLTWRDMALTDLRSMLMRVTMDPAMLRYLDLGTSTGQAPNENYSRELMELFSLGEGAFSENDVRAAAKALSGWTEPKPGPAGDFSQPATGVFVPNRSYRGGALALLGKTDTYDTQKVVDRILAQPATAAFIARKVVQHFVTNAPSESLVKRLADGFRSSKYDIRTLMHSVFTSPEFVADSSYRALVKSPTEYMIHTLRALNAPQLSRLVVQSASTMGQVLFDPPDVGGWPNNDSWISSNTVISRVNFAHVALTQAKTLPPFSDAPRHIDTVLGPATASLLDRAGDDLTRWYLTLASPEFQLK